MKELKKQIQDRCIHFNGLMNGRCDKDIAYDSVKIKDTRPYKIPCLLDNIMTGGSCSHAQFPTEEEAELEAAELTGNGKNAMIARKAIKETGKSSGKVDCPKCGKDLHFTVAESNGHIHAMCGSCNFGWME